MFYGNFITCAKDINCFRILFACWFVDLMQIPRNEISCRFQGTLQIGQKVIIRFWWESGLSFASRNHLTTFCRSFVHYACFRLCSAIVHFIRNNRLYFVCYGWSAQALTQRWARIRTGSDRNFFETWRIRSGSDWENIFCFKVIILNVSKILVVIQFYRFAEWQCNFAINDKCSAETILPFELYPPLPTYNVEFYSSSNVNIVEW